MQNPLKTVAEWVADALVKKITEPIDELGRQIGIMSNRLDTVDRRLDTVDKRLDAVDKRLDAVDQRLDALDRRLDAVDVRLDAIDKRIDKLHAQDDAALEADLSVMDDRICHLIGICRQRGYTTAEERRRITRMHEAYRARGGNHGEEKEFERFLSLPSEEEYHRMRGE